MTTPTTVSVRLQLRADTAANWTSANPTLLANELGRETDTGKIKIGDGSTAWSSLAYQAWATLPIAVASGGTGQTSYTNGQLLIGNTTGNTLTKATLTAGSGIAITNGTGSITVAASGISDAQIAADAEIAVSKLADGTARQLLQTDAAGTGVEWASNIDIPGTLDVTSAATFDSTIGASAGTASLPSITFTGDLNTGIYSPGADQVAISTNGTNRFQIDSSGNITVDTNTFYVDAANNRVGVGTTSPGAPLSVNGNAIIGPEAGTRLAVNLTENDKVELQIVDSTSTARALALTVGATEAARIDSSGRLLVGTSTARDKFFGGAIAAQFQIEGNSTATASLSITRNSNDADGNALVLSKARSTANAAVQYVNGTTSDDKIGRITFQGADGTNFIPAANIECYVDAGVSTNDVAGRLVFSTTADGASSPTERMRISQSGAHDIYSSNYGLATRVSATAGTSTAIYFGSYGATSTGTGTIAYQVWSNGNVQNTNNSYTAISDIKLKENIVDASSQWADLKALQVRNYNLKEGQTHRQIGLIAQEVEPISPGLVYESPDRDAEGNDLGTVTKSVNYSVLYMKAVKALQEAMERIETLEQRLTDAGIN